MFNICHKATCMNERIIDANMNRLREGLRVIEDICRFGLDDAPLGARLKKARHSVQAIREQFPGGDLLSARDSIGDVGRRRIKEPDRRGNLLQTLGASFGRAQESLRVLEEMAKLSSPPAARAAKALRYEVYDLEKAITPRLDRRGKLADRRGLYLVMTEPAVGYEALAEIAIKARVPAIQLRDKTMDSGPLLELARRLRAITLDTQTLLFINDRADIARLCDADGLHLGQTDLSVAEARRIVGDRMLIGKSTHTFKELAAARAETPDMVGVGPVFGTRSKNITYPQLGLDKARKLRERAAMPAVAIGGIESENLPGLLDQGFTLYALIGEVCQSTQPRKVIRRLQAIERASWK